MSEGGFIEVGMASRGPGSATCFPPMAASWRQDVARRHRWFQPSVTDIRMLRIEENNDLAPAIGEPELPFGDDRRSAGP